MAQRHNASVYICLVPAIMYYAPAQHSCTPALQHSSTPAFSTQRGFLDRTSYRTTISHNHYHLLQHHFHRLLLHPSFSRSAPNQQCPTSPTETAQPANTAQKAGLPNGATATASWSGRKAVQNRALSSHRRTCSSFGKSMYIARSMAGRAVVMEVVEVDPGRRIQGARGHRYEICYLLLCIWRLTGGPRGGAGGMLLRLAFAFAGRLKMLLLYSILTADASSLQSGPGADVPPQPA